MKFTKIVATVGPASDSVEILQKMYDAGMDVVRLNFSHGSHEYFHKVIKNIRHVGEDLAILLDTKGPEIRSGDVEGGEIELVDGDEIILVNEPVIGTREKLFLDYDKLMKLEAGNTVLIDDGQIELKIREKRKKELVAKVIDGGKLGSKKTVSIKGHSVEMPFFSEKDREDLMFGINENVTFVAASFVRRKEDVIEIKRFLEKYNSKIKVIAKIEHSDAVKNIKEIMEEAHGIMIARGDLGIETSLELVPRIQKETIIACNNLGKPVIVATQMLESMRQNPRPTRAEVSDIADAIMQGADAVMLSGETTTGKYPVKAVQMAAKIAREYDKDVTNNIDESAIKDRNPVALFVTKAAYLATKNLNIKAILTPTESGFTPRKVSRFRPKCPILAITPDIQVMRQLKLIWGVFPMVETRQYKELTCMVCDLVKKSKDMGFIDDEDRVVVTAGTKFSVKHHTNVLEILYVKEILDKSYK